MGLITYETPDGERVTIVHSNTDIAVSKWYGARSKFVRAHQIEVSTDDGESEKWNTLMDDYAPENAEQIIQEIAQLAEQRVDPVVMVDSIDKLLSQLEGGQDD